jgi:hypothetical protein
MIRKCLLYLLPLGLVLLIVLVPRTSSAFPINNPNSSSGTTSVCNEPGAPTSAYCNETNNTTNNITGTGGIILKAVNIISIIAGVAAVAVIIIGGLRYVLSGGDSNATKGAKDMIIFAIVGLVVIVAAQGIILFVTGKV